MTYVSAKTLAQKWQCEDSKILRLCRLGRIPGAVKEKNQWKIPENTVVPADEKPGRKKDEGGKKILPLPIGVSDYRLASSEYYYVDKTLMIKDFIDERPMVSLFTRPRRFGKTLNMDMVRVFFEKTDEDTSVYFKDKNIWACGEKYREYQGKYPVIFITFKDVKFESWEETYDAIKAVLLNEARRHLEILNSSKCNEFEKAQFRSYLDETVGAVALSGFLRDLSYFLHKHHGIAPIIIVDEYDIPIQQGYMKDYYDKIVLFMRNLFSGGLKDNRHLSFGFLTGVLRVAKESIFSGLNNLTVNSVLDNKYSTYFGFTDNEVMEMVKYYGVEEKYEEICRWYDGYRFGKTDIFNPWSVINYFSNECEPRAFWLSTGSNDIIGEIIAQADSEIYQRLMSLINNESFTAYIDTDVIYPQIKNNPSTVYSFLLVAGYLKTVGINPSFGDNFMCEVAIPNKEILHVYQKEVLRQLENVISPSVVIPLQEAIFSHDSEKLKRALRNFLLQSVSSFDTGAEGFYHGLMLGLCAIVSGAYVTSNRESGEGRYDIQLKPRNNRMPGVLIELKAGKTDCSDIALKTLAETALKQIEEKIYDTEMLSMGVKVIQKYGVAFAGKRVEVASN